MDNIDKTLKQVWEVIEKQTGVKVDTTYRTQYIDVWRDWFQGYRAGFHSYTEKVLGVNKSFSRKSLGGAGRCAKAWADILTREFPVIAISDQSLQDKVEEVLKRENFKTEFVKYLELAFGVGTAAIVEYIVEEEVMIDFLDVEQIVPLSWKNGKIKELATINTFYRDEFYYTHIQYNKVSGQDYIIENTVFKSTDEYDIGVSIDSEEIGISDVIIRDAKPFFQVIKPNITNKIDIDNPLGMAIFQDAMDTVKAIDNKYTEFDNEFCLGKRRIVVSSDALRKEIDTDSGQWVSYMGSDTVYQAVNRSSDEPLFEAVDFALREQSYINALNQEFNFLADSIGMDSGSFIFNGVSMKTATEVISEKSKTFGNKKKHDKMLRDVLMGCVKSIIGCIEIIEGRRYDVEIDITMSDSVLIDEEAQKNSERIDVQGGIMPKTVFLQRNYGLSEEEAIEWIQKANEQQGTVTSATLEGMFQ